MPFPYAGKNNLSNDFEKVRAWEYSETWNNPFCNESETSLEDDNDDDASEQLYQQRSSSRYHHDKKTKVVTSTTISLKKNKKKKKRSKHISVEESSHADSLLSSILSESEQDDVERFAPSVTEIAEEEEDDGDDDAADKDDDCDSMNVLASVRPVVVKKVPSNSPRTRRERPQPLTAKQILSFDEDELGDARRRHQPVTLDDDSMHVHAGHRGDTSSLEDDDHSHDEEKEEKSDHANDDDSNVLNPFNGMDDLIKKKRSDNTESHKKKLSDNTDSNTKKLNPFDDDSEEADSVATDEDNMHIETTLNEERGVIEISPRSKSMTQTSDDGDEHEGNDDEREEKEEEEDEEDDIVESSKRLLRMCDERIQYQQHNEEVQTLKALVERMKTQSEAMAEQLRRAVETKCDLVLAQNEMERLHEQVMINKDQELKDMRMYIQEILEMQAKSELNFMNEISSLARKLELGEENRKKEKEEKDKKIVQLQSKVMDLKAGLVRGNSSGNASRGRLMDSSSSVGSNSTSSKQSLSLRSRQKVHPW
jgi:hypothetical protein